MAVIFCDSATGSDGDNGSTWELAKATLQAAITAAGSGGTVYLADTHSETYTTAQTLTLPAGDTDPVVVISSDVLTGTSVSYKEPTASQFTLGTTAGIDLTLDGNGSFIGVWFSSIDYIIAALASYETLYYRRCKFFLTDTNNLMSASGTGGALIYDNCVFDITDTSASSNEIFGSHNYGTIKILSCSFSGTLTYRNSDLILQGAGTNVILENTDFSGFTGVSQIVTQGLYHGETRFDGCKKYSSAAWIDAVTRHRWATPVIITRCDDNNYGIQHEGYYAQLVDEATVVRTGGASDGASYAWKIVTTSTCRIGRPYATPWMPVWVSSTGSKTWTVHIANTAADLTDTQCWLEVEYLGTADSTVLSIATDRATDILASGTAQTDDNGSSTWGSNPTYLQTLAVTATVNKAGLSRCRVIIAKASATIYVDPQVTVS